MSNLLGCLPKITDLVGACGVIYFYYSVEGYLYPKAIYGRLFSCAWDTSSLECAQDCAMEC